ncbi:MAG: hypothetical protein JRE40_15275 [Deltaproteobacteria bacterium]|nr:hypothetical protein [Deltaproteobacteria bacterium]
MTIRAPLVIINGRIQELPIGDSIAGAGAGSGTGIEAQAATTGEDVVVSEILYLDGSGFANRAQANAIGTSHIIGICTLGATSGNTCEFLTEGVVSISDWTECIGSVSLTPGTLYFLDPSNAGQMVTVAPTTIGQTVVIVGRAVSAQILDLTVTQPILL